MEATGGNLRRPAGDVFPQEDQTMTRAKKGFALVLFLIMVVGFGERARGNPETACDPPYDPSHIIEVLFFYPGTLTYIETAPRQCSKPFADRVRTLVRQTALLTDGCIEATLQDLDEAEARGNN